MARLVDVVEEQPMRDPAVFATVEEAIKPLHLALAVKSSIVSEKDKLFFYPFRCLQ